MTAENQMVDSVSQFITNQLSMNSMVSVIGLCSALDISSYDECISHVEGIVAGSKTFSGTPFYCTYKESASDAKRIEFRISDLSDDVDMTGSESGSKGSAPKVLLGLLPREFPANPSSCIPTKGASWPATPWALVGPSSCEKRVVERKKFVPPAKSSTGGSSAMKAPSSAGGMFSAKSSLSVPSAASVPNKSQGIKPEPVKFLTSKSEDARASKSEVPNSSKSEEVKAEGAKSVLVHAKTEAVKPQGSGSMRFGSARSALDSSVDPKSESKAEVTKQETQPNKKAKKASDLSSAGMTDSLVASSGPSIESVHSSGSARESLSGSSPQLSAELPEVSGMPLDERDQPMDPYAASATDSQASLAEFSVSNEKKTHKRQYDETAEEKEAAAKRAGLQSKLDGSIKVLSEAEQQQARSDAQSASSDGSSQQRFVKRRVVVTETVVTDSGEMIFRDVEKFVQEAVPDTRPNPTRTHNAAPVDMGDRAETNRPTHQASKPSVPAKPVNQGTLGSFFSRK